MSVGGFPTIPTVTTLNTATLDLASLRPGQLVAAQVMQQLEGELLRLAFPQGTFDLPAKVALPVGATVNFEVRRGPEGTTTLNVVSVALPPGRPDAGTPAQPSAASAAGRSAAPLTGAASQAATTSTASAASSLGAAQQQGTAQAPPSAQILANMTTAALKRLIAPVLIADAARQDGLAPLYANVAALAENSAVPLPPQVRAAMQQVLDFRLPGEAPPDGPAIEQAVVRSGLFIATGQAGAGETAPLTLKAALVQLEQALGAWGRSLPPLPAAVAADGQFATQQALSSAGLSLPEGEGDPLLRLGHPAADSAAAKGLAIDGKPPPPHRDAQPHGQRPLAASLGPLMPAQEIASRLIEQTDAALARLELTQLASLPADGEPGTPHLDRTSHALVVEVPIAFGQQTAIAQMRIGEEDRRPGETEPPAWVVRFSLDVEPLGPVHALVRLQGESVGVTLWAERAETSARLKEGAPALDAALADAALSVGNISVRGGKPEAGTAAAAGAFVDRRT